MDHEEKDGYHFAGWYVDKECTKRLNPGGRLPEAMELYPKWVPIVYPIGYILEEGENSPLNPQAFTIESGVIKLFPATCENRQFLGWFFEGKKMEYIPERTSQPLRLVGKFKTPSLITFVSNGGSRIPPRSVDSSGKLGVLPAPVKIGSVFKGWYLDEKGNTPYSPDHVFESDARLYGFWKDSAYPITYVLDGGELIEGAAEDYSIHTDSFILPEARREGYRFCGWKDRRGNPVRLLRHGTIGPQFFTAIWEPFEPDVFVLDAEKTDPSLQEESSAEKTLEQ